MWQVIFSCYSVSSIVTCPAYSPLGIFGPSEESCAACVCQHLLAQLFN